MAKEQEQEKAEEKQAPETAGEDQPEAKAEEQDRTFTQTELDAIIADRLKRERAKTSDYDDLKAKASKLDELEEAQKSELEKAQERADKAEALAKAAEERAQAIALRSAIVAAASRLDFVDPEDAFALLDKSALKQNDEGKLEGVDEALKALAEAKPHLLKQDDQSKARPRRQTPTLPGDNATSASESDAEKDRRLGLG
jgi:hypothetical protein